MISLAELCADQFGPLLGQAFCLETGVGHATEVVLVEVRERPQHRAQGAKRTPFSILLRASDSPSLRQGTFALSHVALGRIELFMTALRPDENGARLEAVFN